jgi:pyruvate dehydrogenase complex dihydrolipoamide acetyltransferase long form
MPALSPTMSQGSLLSWKVAEGQAVNPGDELAEVETDKATMGWEAQEEGYLAKILVPAGTQGVEVGTPVAIMVDEEEQVAAFKDYAPPPAAGGGGAAAGPAAAAVAVEPPAEANSRMGPAARTLLQASGLGLASVRPTGPNSIVTKGDVLAAIAAGGAPAPASPAAPQQQQQQQQQPVAAAPAAAAPAAPAPAARPPPPPAAAPGAAFTDIPTTTMRRVIAARLLESKSTTPHLYLSADVDLDRVAELRAALKQQGLKASVNDCVVRALALALAEVPAANARWDAAAEAVVPGEGVDISIAVATPGGLITPIVRAANTKTLAQVGAEVRELAGRAKLGKLKPDEFLGGSFSISNLGMFGVDSFSAIINPPQACIMAVGGARRVARLGPGGAPVAATVMSVTLSADNRVYDGEVAAALLAAFSRHMANPYMLVGA